MLFYVQGSSIDGIVYYTVDGGWSFDKKDAFGFVSMDEANACIAWRREKNKLCDVDDIIGRLHTFTR